MNIRTLLFLTLAPLCAFASETPEWNTNEGQLILQGVSDIPQALVDRLNQYQNVRSASFVDWTRDGKNMYIRTRFSDISQIHKVHAAGGTRLQLTWFQEPMGEIGRRQKSEELAITMDDGGGEQDQIFLFDPETASTRLITDG